MPRYRREALGSCDCLVLAAAAAAAAAVDVDNDDDHCEVRNASTGGKNNHRKNDECD